MNKCSGCINWDSTVVSDYAFCMSVNYQELEAADTQDTTMMIVVDDCGTALVRTGKDFGCTRFVAIEEV